MGTKKKTPPKAKPVVKKKTVKVVAPAVPVVPFEPDVVESESVVEPVVGKAAFVPTVWRKNRESLIWHFHPECSGWPTENFKERTEPNTHGASCAECQTRSNA